MMRFSSCRLALLAVATTVGLAALPAAAPAFPVNGGTETTQLNMPAGGEGAASTDQIPANSTDGTITVTPANTDLAGSGFDKLVDVVVNTNPAFARVNRTAQRIIACAFISALINNGEETDQGYQFTETDPTFEALTLNLCLRIALTLSGYPTPSTRASTASAGCFMAEKAIAVKITKTHSGYVGQINSPSHKTSFSHSPATITCHRTSRGLQLKIKPRKKGQTLQQAVGPELKIALVNPTSQAIPLKIAFTVHTKH